MLAIVALVFVALATLALLALAAKWMNFGGLFGAFMFLSIAQSILECAGQVVGAILSAAAGSND